MKKKKIEKKLSKLRHKCKQPLSVINIAATSIQVQKELDILTDQFLIDATDKILKNIELMNKELKKLKI